MDDFFVNLYIILAKCAKILDMKDFRKRSLVLMLASVIAVTGSFAAENYKNCLMNLEFKSTGANEINMVLNTQKLYEGKISPIRKDANTFVVMLPEVDSSAPTPDITKTGGNIESVRINKRPYANGSKGYTIITVKTSGNVNLTASNALYIADNSSDRLIEHNSSNEDIEREKRELERRSQSQISEDNRAHQTETQKHYQNKYKTSASPVNKEEITEQNDENADEEIIEENNSDENNQETISDETPTEVMQPMSQDSIQNKISTENESHQKFLLALLAVFIVITGIYFYIKAQDKMTNVIGEKFEIDLDENDEKKRKNKNDKKAKRISRTINKLDAAYSKTSVMPVKTPVKEVMPEQNQTTEDAEELNIVDLDALFKEQTKTSKETDNSTENAALDDFLSGFSFEEEDTDNAEHIEESPFSYDENVYAEVINDNNLTFNDDDIRCFNELLQSEISGEVMNNIDKYAISNPIKPQKPSTEKILANIVSDYSVNQNISFSAEDIDIIKKLISVEIDQDFVTDLRTNPQRVSEMEREISEAKSKKPKPTKIMTLNVKDLLPNLADALKKQGNRPIESNAKPETIYFNEGYEVSTLSEGLNNLPDLSKEIKNKNAYQTEPTAKIQVVDNNYIDSVKKLTISGLPDLDDVLAHPEKYEDKQVEEYVADEEALLNSIANVQFKPFDDGTRKFEIINDFDEEEEVEATPNVSEIRNEFNQFENFVVTNDDYEPEPSEINEEYDDFEELYNQEYFDLDSEEVLKNSQTEDKNKIAGKQEDKVSKSEFVPQDLNRQPQHSIKERSNTQYPDLLKELDKINQNNKQNITVQNTATNNTAKKVEAAEKNGNAAVKCIIEGVNYDIINTVEITSSLGCHLAKSNNKYIVLAYKDSDLKIIKEYDSIKSEKIQARISETLADGTPRYLVKVGLNKFIVDIKDGDINYVMDLC